MLNRTLLLTGLRDLWRRPLHTGLMVLGVALGVAVVVSIDIAGDSASQAFASSTQALVGRATHRVIGGPSGVSSELYRLMRGEWGYRSSTPVVEGWGLALDLDGQPLRILGVDPLSEAPFREGLGGALLGRPGFSRFFTDPRAVILDAGMAHRYGLGLDSPLRLQVGDRIHELVVYGLLDAGGSADGREAEGVLFMDVGAAQQLLGLADRLTRIDVIASSAEADALAARLPSGARLVPASEHSETLGQLTEAFLLNLSALSLLALVVGMFLIYNTVMFSVVQRRAVLGTLRVLGVTRGQILALILVEAAVASTLGAVLGLGIGWLLGQGAVQLVTRTINDLYYVLAVTEAPLRLATVLKGVGLGIGAGVLAALPPGLEASRVEPVTAMRPSTLEGSTRNWLARLAASGVGLVGLGALVMRLATQSLHASFLGLFAIVLGLALAVPWTSVMLMRLAAPVVAWLAGTLGRLAAGTVARSISRTGVAVAALMVAVSVTISVSLMIASFRATVTNWLDLTLVADIYVSAPSGRITGVVSADVPERIRQVPGVASVETFRRVRVHSPGRGGVSLGVTDAPRGRRAELYGLSEGDPAQVWSRVRDGGVIVSEPFAYHQAPLEGRLVLDTDRGQHSFTICGIFYDYSSQEGLVLMSRSVYERFWDDRGVDSVAVYLDEGVETGSVTDQLRATLSDTALRVVSNRGLRQRALEIFDRTFVVTNALRLLAVVVAFIGVWSALLALQVERTRELATLRALGMTPGQLWGLSLLETGLMGGAAGLLSLPTGTLLAAILIEVINVRSFGWTMQMLLDPWLAAQAIALSVGASLAATIYPLLRLGRIPVASALRQE